MTELRDSHSTSPAPEPFLARGLWASYFVGKIFLHQWGALHFDVPANLLLLLLVWVPIPAWRWRRTLQSTRAAVAIVAALLLLWSDSWLPPLVHALDFVTDPSFVPSTEYLVGFAMRYVASLALVALLGISALCLLLARRRIPLAPGLIVAMLVVNVLETRPAAEQLDWQLKAFYASEAKRRVDFATPKPGAPDFDILLVHVCSLSHDDLEAAGLRGHAFFRQFDILLERYNTVSSYSNPSAFRLLRAGVGQGLHGDLYGEAPKEAYLLDALRERGWETYSVYDHEGNYGDYTGSLSKLGKADAPMDLEGLPATLESFDEALVFDALPVLERWWDIRQESGERRAALFFNTISLHDGTHPVGKQDWWNRDRVEEYRRAAETLFESLSKLFALIEASERNAIVFFVPEHGMALRGTAIQAEGLRDIPLPRITTVPVGVKFIGEGRHQGAAGPRVVSESVSHLALAHLLSSFIEEPPFGEDSPRTQSYLEDLPETRFVSENEGVTVIEAKGRYFVFGKEEEWIELPPEAAASPAPSPAP